VAKPKIFNDIFGSSEQPSETCKCDEESIIKLKFLLLKVSHKNAYKNNAAQG
jgi:hypothetical protein